MNLLYQPNFIDGSERNKVALTSGKDTTHFLVLDNTFCHVGTCLSWDGKLLLMASSDGTLVVLCRN